MEYSVRAGEEMHRWWHPPRRMLRYVCALPSYTTDCVCTPSQNVVLQSCVHFSSTKHHHHHPHSTSHTISLHITCISCCRGYINACVVCCVHGCAAVCSVGSRKDRRCCDAAMLDGEAFKCVGPCALKVYKVRRLHCCSLRSSLRGFRRARASGEHV